MIFKFSLPTKIKNQSLDKFVHFLIGLAVGGIVTYVAITLFKKFF